MVQITRTGIITDDHTLTRLREAFVHHRTVVLPQLIEPSLLKHMAQWLQKSAFFLHTVGPCDRLIGRELMMQPRQPLHHAFNLLCNHPQLFQAVQDITGCPPIGSFYGRIYRLEPHTDQFATWHSDNRYGRLIGMSLNLNTAPYEGGMFHIRERGSGRLLGEGKQTVLGDAHLFEIGPHLEHCVSPLTGHVARTAAAGWFCSQPDRQTALRKLASISLSAPAASAAQVGGAEAAEWGA